MTANNLGFAVLGGAAGIYIAAKIVLVVRRGEITYGGSATGELIKRSGSPRLFYSVVAIHIVILAVVVASVIRWVSGYALGA